MAERRVVLTVVTGASSLVTSSVTLGASAATGAGVVSTGADMLNSEVERVSYGENGARYKYDATLTVKAAGSPTNLELVLNKRKIESTAKRGLPERKGKGELRREQATDSPDKGGIWQSKDPLSPPRDSKLLLSVCPLLPTEDLLLSKSVSERHTTPLGTGPAAGRSQCLPQHHRNV